MIEFLQNRYNKLEERDGVPVLVDESKCSILCGRLDELEDIYRNIRAMLIENDYPVRREWILAVVEEGAEGLKRVILQDTDADARRLKVSFRIAEQWRRTVIQEVPTEVWEKCDNFRSNVVSLSQGLPRLSYEFTDEGIFLDKPSASKEIRDACSCVVTEQMRKEADDILRIVNEVRKMELDGLNATELIKRYITGNDTPDLLSRYRDVASRRHARGCIAPTNMDPFINITHNI